jgi:5-methylcytosine-specific restriction endonuclease McrA
LFIEGNKIKSTSCAKSIKNKWEYNNAFSIISSENAKQGNIEEAIFQVQNINDEWFDYHKKTAKLRCLCKQCNVSRNKKYIKEYKEMHNVSLEESLEGQVKQYFDQYYGNK